MTFHGNSRQLTATRKPLTIKQMQRNQRLAKITKEGSIPSTRTSIYAACVVCPPVEVGDKPVFSNN